MPGQALSPGPCRRRPAIFAPRNTTISIFAVVINRGDGGDIGRYVDKCVSIDNAPCATIGLDYCTNVYTAFAAEKKVRCFESKSIALQFVQALGTEFNVTERIGGAKRVMCTAEPALAGTNRPLGWRALR